MFKLCLDEIKDIIKPELRPLLLELYDINPKSLMEEDDIFFTSENELRGFVWKLFILKASGQSFKSFF